MNEKYLDFVRQILDRQVIDANHFECGKVDDLEIDLEKTSRVTAIYIGNGAASERLPEIVKFVSQKIFGTRTVKIPWSEVLVVTDRIKLKSTAKELELDERQGWIYKFISRLPMAWKK
jgi:sporulation protein YlmC with PRC-barrel domain